MSGAGDEVAIPLWRRLAGLSLLLLTVGGLYVAYAGVPEPLRATLPYRGAGDLIRLVPSGFWRTLVQDYRLVLEVLIAIFVVGAVDWIWRKTLGRAPH